MDEVALIWFYKPGSWGHIVLSCDICLLGIGFIQNVLAGFPQNLLYLIHSESWKNESLIVNPQKY